MKHELHQLWTQLGSASVVRRLMLGAGMRLFKVGSGMSRPTSLVVGRDSDVLDLLFAVHSPDAVDVLDATHNKGVMWKSAVRAPSITNDIDPQWDTDLTADCRSLPLPDSSLDVIVFDPPHLPSAVASAGSSGIEHKQYGLGGQEDWRSGDTVAPLFEGFLVEAQRLLRPDGLVFAKLTDLVHNHRYQWQHVDFVLACQRAGMTPCDLAVKADPTSANLKSSKWKTVHHLRRAHTYWFVVRNSRRCERRSGPVSDGEGLCPTCGGRGDLSLHDVDACETCDGSGFIGSVSDGGEDRP